MIKNILIKLAQKFKQLPYFGRQRFWFLYWCYKITGWHIRHEEWDFVLKYLPKLNSNNQFISILDVGCNKSLFCHEVKGRGYRLIGLDLEKPQFKYPGIFINWDITNLQDGNKHLSLDGFNFVTCISVLEHIGNDGKGDFAKQKEALENMCKSLKIGGRLLLTCPTKEFAQGHIWHGFTWADIASIMPNTMRAIESTERAGQLCMALERVA